MYRAGRTQKAINHLFRVHWDYRRNNLHRRVSHGKRIECKVVLGKSDYGTGLKPQKNDYHIPGGNVCYFIGNYIGAVHDDDDSEGYLLCSWPTHLLSQPNKAWNQEPGISLHFGS